MNPEEELVRRAQQGNRRAFDALCAQHRPRILSHCIRLLESTQEGEQAAQDIFVLAWKKVASFRFESPFGHWLVMIATHTCLNLTRPHKGRAAAHGIPLPDTLPTEEFEAEVINQVYAQQIRQ